MPAIGFRCNVTNTQQGFEEHIQECLKHDECPMHPVILRALIPKPYERLGAGISVTSIVSNICSRSRYYGFTENYYIDPAKSIASFRGTWVHAMLESQALEQVELLIEKRFARRVYLEDGKNWFWLTGQMDYLDPINGELDDWKNADHFIQTETDKFDYEKVLHYSWQLELYRWILEEPSLVEIDPITKEVFYKEWEPIEIKKMGLYFFVDGYVKDGYDYRNYQKSGVNLQRFDIPVTDANTEYLLQEARELYLMLENKAVPLKIQMKPEKDTFCTQWCNHQTRCLELKNQTKVSKNR